ncbi:g_PROTEIN_RECEP_F1_2 domain-containing protein [Caerostris extrusa]|uniref:G_PROTEIN_RECEP_F1_2 domain-containing protein n=1 Tax=Caerostris extrusa TaxID=172846 RepID=A0AAV4XYY8_CAEEX|nr:g_PROTEIN_RECEP_F1_2 domain-containing protein [Caerostris extrusa]
MSCFLTQSSSDGGSNASDGASMRTGCTVDVNARPKGSLMRALTKKRSSQKIITQYIKKTGVITFSNNNSNSKLYNSVQQDKCNSSDLKINCLMNHCPPMKVKLNGHLSSSVGDVTKLFNSSSELSPNGAKRCLSCVTINSEGR